ncbi:MAG: 3-hydroxyacyl-CoA dehydrogenase [Bacteroidetes bacterium]|nr:MAG: 3-hydroxyacyl-CoA dehydrogenase [Bacteroidota bacterium]
MINYNKDSDGIAVISINMEGPVNIINEEFIIAFEEQINESVADTSVKGIIITSGKKEFMLGADLKLIASVKTAGEIMPLALRQQKFLRKMETSGKPVVAAINGTALGGGFEICLACHHRIAVNDSNMQIGLPEVLLGLLPGGGGTQRLPRMIGIHASLPLLLEGKKLRPEQALKAGMVDALVASREELITAAKDWIKKCLIPSPSPTSSALRAPSPKEKGSGNNFLERRVSCLQPWDEKGYKIPGGGVQHPDSAMVLAAASGLIVKKTYGNYPAASAIINCVFEGLQLPFDKAMVVECRYFTQCVLSVESKNMIRTLFVNMNEANKGAARPANIQKTDIKKIGVLGAGMMGAGIAYVSASNGLDVVLKDITKEAAEKGKEYSVKLVSEKLSKNHITKEQQEDILNKIQTTADAKDIAGCDLVIEAVFENRELKAMVTKEAESVMSVQAVFASNTSTLPITGLAKASSRPENFIGLHFFSPVEKMQLVEIIVGKKTSDYAIAMAIDYIKRIKKTPIVVNDGRGFYTSRVFATYLFEGFNCLAEGISPALIENAGKMAGMPIGPLALADEVSIDLCYHINQQMEVDTGKKREDAAIGVVNKFIEELHRPGKKAKKGFYEYPENEKKYLWTELSKHFPLAEQQPDVLEVRKRLLYIQSLEAVKCFEENIVTKPADADIGSILGWGFPPYTGGVLSFIDMIGVKKFVEECNRLAKKHGKRFNPGSFLKRMAAEDIFFYTEKIHSEEMPVNA